MKTSNIFEEKEFVKSGVYTSLAPRMKEAVKEFWYFLEKEDFETLGVIKRVDTALDKIAEKHDVNKREMESYFDKEVREQLKLTVIEE